VTARTIILASASPRRQAILSQLGLPFLIRLQDVEEDLVSTSAECAADAAERLACRKAAVGASEFEAGLVIAADTVVVANGRIYGKPADAEEAGKMLRELSGRSHYVITGVAVYDVANGRLESGYARTRVTFRPLTDEVIAAYVASQEPLDKAGAYGIQGLGSLLVESIAGCYFNVVGLPLALLTDLLAAHGFDIWRASRRKEGD
jgi:septum formation protein